MTASALGKLVALSVLFVAVAALSPCIGPTVISLAKAFDRSISYEQNPDAVIFFATRLPRVLFACVAGAALAVAGALMQCLFRNDLATPDTLGVSSAAALGALVSLQFLGIAAQAGVAAGALAAALGAIALVLLAARSLGAWERSATLLLLGVSLNILFGAAILVAQYVANPFETYRMVRWMMGAVDVSDLRTVGTVAAFVVPCVAAATMLGARMNALASGDFTAHSLGVAPERTRLAVLALAGFCTAMIVAHAGPIGFVGLVVPHLLRLWIGGDHRLLLPASALGGGIFLVAADAIARVAGGGIEIPVGVVTAIVGGPALIVMLLRRAAGEPTV